jgi:acetylglutamate kinase
MGLALVISPISLGRDGHTYNVNADHGAAALAAAVGASALAFVTNVPGVLTDGGLVEQLTAQQTRELIQAGVISGGMVPKVQAALDALDHGVVAVKIVDLHGLQTGGGTELIRDA